MLRGITSIFIIAICLSFSGQVLAKKKAATAVEVSSISVKLNLGGNSGSVTAEGCEKCPLFLKFTAQTKFLAKGQQVQAKSAASYSGKPGTVIFDAKSNQIVKVIW